MVLVVPSPHWTMAVKLAAVSLVKTSLKVATVKVPVFWPLGRPSRRVDGGQGSCVAATVNGALLPLTAEPPASRTCTDTTVAVVMAEP